MTKRIEDYALIGDCESAALVSRDGSIDWLCWPRFDSGALFAALLGAPENGHWSMSATGGAAVRRRYREGGLILETDFETASGSATLIDFMPFDREGQSRLVRIVEGRSGEVEMATELMFRFDYGLIVPWVTRLCGCEGLQAIAGPDMAILHAEACLKAQGLKHSGVFTIRAGETVSFTLSYGLSFEAPPSPIDPLKALDATEKAWRRWSERCSYSGPYEKAVRRSLITLKGLTYHPTGGIAAAATTSLPEEIGGARNWDYRFCWLRDATFTLIALMNAGYYEDARAWRQWLLRAVAGAPDRVQIMYAVTGERRLPEWEVSWLSGYQGAKPVRAGNAAAEQTQIDVYGEVMDAIHHGRHGKLGPSDEGWQLQRALLDHLERSWEEPGHGIWEVRGDRQRFTNSRVMAWVAFDRAVKTVEQFNMDGPVERWRNLRRVVHQDVCRFGFDPSLGAFVQSYGAKHLDASALLIPLVGFLPPEDPRVRSTVEAIKRRLIVDGLVRRYDSEAGIDGLPAGEGVFLPCSFWLADNLILLGRHDEARALFERLLSLRNDVGLLSEEYDVTTKRLIGNFPQALSHVALVNTAHHLTERNKHKRHESEQPAAHDAAA